jgi:hypothetical protein
MNKEVVLRCLRKQWEEHLLRHGHFVRQMSDPRVLRSCDRRGECHRWLLLVGNRPEHRLRRWEQDFIRIHLRDRREEDKVYLVVGFSDEPGRIVALPARTALKAGHIDADRAGVAWDGWAAPIPRGRNEWQQEGQG